MASPQSVPAPSDPPAPYGGYAITALKEAGGEETLRFEAHLTKDGKKFARVSNGGFGGSHSYHPLADGPEGREALRAFEAYATQWNRGNELAGYEDNDQLVNRLIEALQLNRLRSLAFVLDGGDPWAGADVLILRGASREEALETLRRPPYAERQPRVWSRERGDFVPLD